MSDKDWDGFNNDVDNELRKKEIVPLWAVVTVLIFAVTLGIVGIIMAGMSLCN